MAHELEFINGKAQIAYNPARGIPWHTFGTQVPENADAETIAIAAGVNWNVAAQPIFTASGLEIPGYRAITRDIDNKVFGITTDSYRTIQNLDVFKALGDLPFETAGSLRGGSRIWGLARVLEEDILIGGKDRIKPYVLAAFGHDGVTPITVKATATRVVCANTEAIALRGRGISFNIRHTESATQRIAEATKVIRGVRASVLEQAEALQKLADTTCSEELREKVFDAVTPPADPEADEDERRKAQQARLNLWRNWQYSKTVEFADRDTRWGVFNAVTEYIDWREDRRGQNPKSANKDWLERRAVYSLDGAGAERRQKAFELLAV